MRALLAFVLVLLLGGEAWARVGGGESFGGGGGGGFGGSGGGGADDAGFLIYLLIRLVFAYPAVGIPLVIVCAIGWMWMQAQSSGLRDAASTREWSRQVTPQRRASADLEALRAADPNFSRPLFLDFLNLLYTRVQQERTGDLAALGAYLAPDLRQRLVEETRRAGVDEIRDVIVGAVRLASVEMAGGRQSLTADLETNFTEAGKPVYSVERWTLSRKAGVLSQGPEAITRLACPSCGSPGELRPDGTCPFCGQRVNDGSFAWVVQEVQVLQRTDRPSMDLRSGGEEIGTDLPTVMQPDFEVRRKEFMARHPDFAWPAFEARVRHVFLSLQAAWSQQKWELARPFETDHLFSVHRYWIETYRREGLVNRLEDVQVSRVTPVKVETDAWFDALTVRIWASMKDWKEEAANGRLVAGSKTADRRFSEYWTFLRRAGYQGKGSGDPATCPSCGAPLEIGMTGVCPFCDSKVTTGEFDWVLTLIEQDEAYQA